MPRILPRTWDRLSAWALSCLKVKASPAAGLGDRGAPWVLSRLWLCGPGRPGWVWRVSWWWRGSTLELEGEQGCREEGRAWPLPKAPPLSLEGARSWFPAPAWEPRPQRGRKLLPGVCRASGRWERQLLNFPHAPRAQAGPPPVAAGGPGRAFQLQGLGFRRPGAGTLWADVHVDRATTCSPTQGTADKRGVETGCQVAGVQAAK